MFTPWTMKDVPRPCKICDWQLNSSWDHFGLQQGKRVRVIMEFEISKRHILGFTLSIEMVKWVLRWERQKRCSGKKRQGPMAEEYYYNKVLMNFYLKNEDKRRLKNGRTWFFLQSFLGHKSKKSTQSLFGAWSFLVVQIWFTPSESPKRLCRFLRNWIMGVGPSSWTMGIGHFPWSNFMVDGVNRPQVLNIDARSRLLATYNHWWHVFGPSPLKRL